MDYSSLTAIDNIPSAKAHSLYIPSRYTQGSVMFKLAKIALVAGILTTLTACTGHVQNTKNNCSYDYLLHPAISISRIIDGCGPAANQ